MILIEKQTRWEADSAAKIALMEEAKRREKEEKEKAELLEVMNLAVSHMIAHTLSIA